MRTAPAEDGPARRDRAERLRAHVEWLADPAREGRGVGTAAERGVALDLARRFAEAGLEPAGEEGFLQPVPLVAARMGPGWLALRRPGGQGWTAPDDAVAVRCPGLEGCRAEGPGNLARLEPPRSPLETTSAQLRLERLLRELAVGAEAPAAPPVPVVLVRGADWDEALAGLRAPRFGLAGSGDPAGLSTNGLVAAVVNAERAPDWIRDLPTGTRLELEAVGSVEVAEATGWNVAGILRGSDPEKAVEAVVLTAHHDHLGVSPIAGKRVYYPGVVDNALSVAELVETARLLAGGPRPPRSIVFLSPTAEEVGFLGTRRWLARPPSGTPRPVANWNHDGASEAWGRAATAVLVTGGSSLLAAPFAEVARAQGVEVVPNPFPSEGFFFRSDHYVFVEVGIPAALVFLGPGFAGRSPGWGIERAAAYLREAYHQPADDLHQIETWEGALQFVELWAALARTSATTW